MGKGTGKAARPRDGRSAEARQRGQAAVDLVATLPFLGLALLVAAQIAIAGAAMWSAAIAARAGARAEAVGGGARGAARRALPPPLRGGAEVSDGDGVRVRVRVPGLVPGLPRLAVGARSALGVDGGGP
jgi:hypothetical protein